jgi:hypothetical protein
VIEPLLAIGPVDQLELSPNMIPMAGGTVSSLLGYLDDTGVVALVGGYTISDLGMAVQALENGLASSKRMTLSAAERAIETPVCIGKIPGRKLPL